jgi:hypothetical protein
VSCSHPPCPKPAVQHRGGGRGAEWLPPDVSHRCGISSTQSSIHIVASRRSDDAVSLPRNHPYDSRSKSVSKPGKGGTGRLGLEDEKLHPKPGEGHDLSPHPGEAGARKGEQGVGDGLADEPARGELGLDEGSVSGSAPAPEELLVPSTREKQRSRRSLRVSCCESWRSSCARSMASVSLPG